MENKDNTLEKIKNLKKEGRVYAGTYDSTFKSIMQDEDIKDFTAFIISNCNGRNIEAKKMVFVNTEGTKKTIADKVCVTDILIDYKDNRIGMEANRKGDKELRNRNLSHFYEGASKTINISYRIGKALFYEQINFDAFDNGDDLVSVYRRMNVKTGKIDPDEQNIIKYRINLALVYKKYYTYSEKLTRFEKALAILLFDKVEDLRRIAEGDEMLMRAEKKIEELSENPDLIKYIDDEKAMEFGHKQDIEEAYEDGRTLGIESGKEMKKIEIAKKMLKDKLDIDVISKYTGLSKKQIEDL